jgi:hypothetical protein
MKKTTNFYQVLQIFLGLVVIEGVIANIIYFQSPSEAQNVFLWGYSFQRLALGVFSSLLLVVFIGFFVLSFTAREFLKSYLQKLVDSLGSPMRRILVLLPLAIILALDLSINLVYAFPALLKLGAFITVKRSLLQQTGMVQIWGFLIPIQLWAFLFLFKFLIFCLMFGGQGQTGQSKLSLTGRLLSLFGTATATVLVLSLLWDLIFKSITSVALTGPAGKMLVLSIWFLIWFTFDKKDANWTTRYVEFFVSLSIWLVTFLVAAQVAQWMDSLNTPFKNYWNWLAEAFLQGRLYLIDPPSTGDMTLYNGKWYVPIPPLPAFLLVPFIAIWGVEGFNTTLLSLALYSTTSVLLYLTLEELSSRSWIKLSREGIVWLVVLFSFGTVQLWLSVSSVVWYFSQICTILFVAMAFFLVVKRFPAWLTGLALALALLGRPNVFVLWPALVLITLQLQLDLDGKFSWKRLLTWSAWSAIPVFLSAGFLLYYNLLRFGDFLDFGYVNINGSARVVRLVQEYGMFNPYFIPTNLHAMFLALPEMKAKCDYFFPRGSGLSLIATTPAFLYALRRYKFSWWLLGCWTGILLSIALLLTYHNTGSVQIAYRYVLDFIIPLVLVIAFTAGERISIPLKVLIILSIMINYYAVVSWYHGPC